MICKNCAEAADLERMELHELCKGPSWCDCAHKSIIGIPLIEVIDDGRTGEDRKVVRGQD